MLVIVAGTVLLQWNWDQSEWGYGLWQFASECGVILKDLDSILQPWLLLSIRYLYAQQISRVFFSSTRRESGSWSLEATTNTGTNQRRVGETSSNALKLR